MRFIQCILFLLPFSVFSGINKTPPHAFIQNKGQVVNQDYLPNPDVLYMYSGNGIKVQLRKSGYSYELYSVENAPACKAGKRTDAADMKNITTHMHRVDVDFYGANASAEVMPASQKKELLHYVTYGQEIYNVPSFEKVTYSNIYNNIDIEFILTGSENNPLKYNIILRPGANINDLQFLYKGADAVKLYANALSLQTSLGTIAENIPFSYYTDQPAQNQPVAFHLKNNMVSFTTKYDALKTLVIDPSSNIIWGTYFGGSSIEYCNGSGIDAQNNVYITGQTLSTSNIATNGVYQTTLSGNTDMYLAKFDNSGNLLWGTYFGGSNFEQSFAIFVEPNGAIYISGDSGSNSGVASVGSHQSAYGGGIDDCVLAKFSPAGQRIWSTYYGGNQHDFANCVTVDNSGNVVIGGHTESSNTGSCIATAGAFNTAFTFFADGFVAKFNTNGVRQWGTYYGEAGNEEVWGVSTDAPGNVYFTGFTTSLANISTAGSHQQMFGGGTVDAFIGKLAATGNILAWATYYGGSADDQGVAVEVGLNGLIYIGGNTGSNSNISTPGSHQQGPASAEDVFLTCFNSSGVRQWGTYYGGTSTDYIYDLTLDPQLDLIICGQTLSTNSISVPDAYQPSIGMVNTYDGYFAKIKSNGSSLVLGSYYGGGGNDASKGVALDAAGKLFLCGETTTTLGLTTPGSYMPNSGGGGDAFLARFCFSPKPQITPQATATLCLNDSYTLTAQGGFNSYFWNNFVTTNTVVISNLLPGDYYYTVMVYDNYGCSGASDSVKVVVNNCLTSLEEINSTYNVSLFPIPAHDQLCIEGIAENYTAEVFDASGKLVITEAVKTEKAQINTSGLSNGIYVLKCTLPNGICTKKFIKN